MSLAKERDEAFTDFITTGNTKKVMKYCKKYGVKIPEAENAFAAGIYKAAIYCENIPADVKKMAKEKCIALGFKPYIWR